jgi:hypothetical protein
MIANRDKTAEEHFQKKLVPAWRKYPFFFRPVHDGSDRPKRAINFVAPATKDKDKAKGNFSLEVLDTVIDFADIANRIYYDGNKITGGLLLDEEGKDTNSDIYEGWNIVKPSMSQGGGSSINPYAVCWHPSTVEEMESGGGANYKRLVDDSDFYQRNPLTGQTRSGLFYFFLPAYDGLENFIGPYGESVIDTPTPEQAAWIKKNFGAKEYLKRKVAEFVKSDSPSARDDMESFVRKHPTYFRDCWQIRGGDLGFDQKKLDEAIERLGKDKKATLRGTFYWQIPGLGRLTAAEFIKKPKALWSDIDSQGKVVFEPDEEGKFFVSETMFQSASRVRDHEKGHWRPAIPDKYIASADPVMYNLESQTKLRSDKSRTSFPAGVVFKNLDEDEIEKPMEEWNSYRFVCDYCHKTDDEDEYLEEMLMMSVYYGAMMYPEVNIKSVVKWFNDRGYGGYLKYDFDESSGTFKSTPGFFTGGSSTGGVKDELFTEIKNHIHRHSGREKHLNIIMQWKRIQKKEEMTKFDLIPCTGGALRAIKYSPRIIDFNYGKEAKKDDRIDLADYFGYAF